MFPKIPTPLPSDVKLQQSFIYNNYGSSLTTCVSYGYTSNMTRKKEADKYVVEVTIYGMTKREFKAFSNAIQKLAKTVSGKEGWSVTETEEEGVVKHSVDNMNAVIKDWEDKEKGKK